MKDTEDTTIEVFVNGEAFNVKRVEIPNDDEMAVTKSKPDKYKKDKFEIFIDIVCREFNKDKFDNPICLFDLVKIIQKTNSVYRNFDETLSVEENVNNLILK